VKSADVAGRSRWKRRASRPIWVCKRHQRRSGPRSLIGRRIWGRDCRPHHHSRRPGDCVDDRDSTVMIEAWATSGACLCPAKANTTCC
jgi:hypothetical protein